MKKIRCICINDANKPNEIKPNLWIKKGEQYTITHIYYHYQQGIQGCELKEVQLDDSCFPYQSFALTRFAIAKDDIPKLIQMIKDCSDLNDIDVKELIKDFEVI